jgi:hypothetical protein
LQHRDIKTEVSPKSPALAPANLSKSTPNPSLSIISNVQELKVHENISSTAPKTYHTDQDHQTLKRENLLFSRASEIGSWRSNASIRVDPLIKNEDEDDIEKIYEPDDEDLSFGYSPNSTQTSSPDGGNEDEKIQVSEEEATSEDSKKPKGAFLVHVDVNFIQCGENGNDGAAGASSWCLPSKALGNPSSSRKGKRKRDDDDSRPPGERDEDQRKRKKGQMLPDGRDRFKCPLYLREPRRYWQNACRGNGWQTMKDLL